VTKPVATSVARGRRTYVQPSVEIRKRMQTDQKKRALKCSAADATMMLSLNLQHTSLSSTATNSSEPKFASLLVQTIDLVMKWHSSSNAPASNDCITQSIKVVRFIVSDDREQYTKTVVQSGIVQVLTMIVHEDRYDASLQNEAVWILVNITSTDETPVVALSGVVPDLVHHMKHSKDNALRENCITCIGNIAAHSSDFRETLLSEQSVLDGL
jgi:hypothetical protein